MYSRMRYRSGKAPTQFLGGVTLFFDGVHDQVTHMKDGVADAFTATDQSLGAGNQLSKIEGFAEIVVGASVEQLDDRCLGIDGSENQYRGFRSPRARMCRSTSAPAPFSGSIRSR